MKFFVKLFKIILKINNNWIPISKNLPKINTPVMIYSQQCGVSIGMNTGLSEDFGWYDFIEDDYIKVSFWQDIISPPKNKKNVSKKINSSDTPE